MEFLQALSRSKTRKSSIIDALQVLANQDSLPSGELSAAIYRAFTFNMNNSKSFDSFVREAATVPQTPLSPEEIESLGPQADSAFIEVLIAKHSLNQWYRSVSTAAEAEDLIERHYKVSSFLHSYDEEFGSLLGKIDRTLEDSEAPGDVIDVEPVVSLREGKRKLGSRRSKLKRREKVISVQALEAMTLDSAYVKFAADAKKAGKPLLTTREHASPDRAASPVEEFKTPLQMLREAKDYIAPFGDSSSETSGLFLRNEEFIAELSKEKSGSELALPAAEDGEPEGSVETAGEDEEALPFKLISEIEIVEDFF